jgi:hypothetical protein
MLGSGSGGSKRSGTRDLIKGADCRSDGPGQRGKEGAAPRRQRPKPAAARLEIRRSSAFPPLRGSNLHDFKPGSTTATRGIDLELRLGLEELGLRDPRLGAEDIAGERRSRGYELPKTMISGARAPRKGVEAHQGLGVAGAAAEGGRRRGPAAETVRCSRGGVLPRLSGLLGTGDRRVKVLWKFQGD